MAYFSDFWCDTLFQICVEICEAATCDVGVDMEVYESRSIEIELLRYPLEIVLHPCRGSRSCAEMCHRAELISTNQGLV